MLFDPTAWKYQNLKGYRITERNYHLERWQLWEMARALLKKKHKYLQRKYNKKTHEWEFWAIIPDNIIPKVSKSKSWKRAVIKRKKRTRLELEKEKAERVRLKEKKRKKMLLRKEREDVKRAERSARLRKKKQISKWNRKLKKEVELKKRRYSEIKVGIRDNLGRNRKCKNIDLIIHCKYKFKWYRGLVQDQEGTYWRLPYIKDGNIIPAQELKPFGVRLYIPNRSVVYLSCVQRAKIPSGGKIIVRKLIEKLKNKLYEQIPIRKKRITI